MDLFHTTTLDSTFATALRQDLDGKVDEPRLTAEYADIAEAPESLQYMAKALSEHYGIPYDGVWLNLYRDNRDGAGWHGDWITCRRERCVVPVLSLGATRRFLQARETGPRISLNFQSTLQMSA